MAFTIQDLINQRVFPNVKLQAGHKGSKNEIHWINIMEILDAPESVQPGELLFSTGCGLQQQDQHEDLIARLAKRGVSGIAIQIGYYIESIPEYILEQANALDFPVLSLPKNLTFSEILHTMMQLIPSDFKKNWGDNVLKQSYLFLERSLTSRQSEIFPENDDQCVQVLLLAPVNYTNVEEKGWRKCLAQICSFIQSRSRICLCHELPQHKYVFLTTHSSHENCLPMLYGLNIKFTLLSEQYGTNYYLGAERLRSPDDLMTTLNHATEALDTLQLIQARRGVCSYDNIRLIKMFGHLHRKDSSVVLDNQPLQVLLNYDKVNNTNYMQTLRIYLSNNCNMTQTAAQLFVHRHTLIKRLSKISSIGGLNLDDYYTRIYMSIALLFHDYFIY
ncbi:PucR family transcriptional regulator [Oscillospiraceae bacterium LTW-04]|nr:PucR family transcriptional regulator ligand-binding domain-containing protein [Oscillospiraceae bacterium MB24-C1]